VIIINVMATEDYAFAGDDLLKVLLGTGLSFGEMDIFHQHLGSELKAPVLFSVANILNPGTFDLNNMDTFSTTGVSLFLALPAAINNLEAFEQMLAVAQQIQVALGGELKDEHRNVMTTQTMEHYRQRINDFELRCLKAVGGRG
jgi:cell division protein ZipA